MGGTCGTRGEMTCVQNVSRKTWR